MAAPLHTVAETDSFLRDAKDVGMTDAEREAIVAAAARYPEAGDPVAGTGGVHKQRHGSEGKGKRGSYRIMVATVGPDAPVYLIAVLKKGERANFTPAEIKALKAMTTKIRESWRGRRGPA